MHRGHSIRHVLPTPTRVEAISSGFPSATHQEQSGLLELDEEIESSLVLLQYVL